MSQDSSAWYSFRPLLEVARLPYAALAGRAAGGIRGSSDRRASAACGVRHPISRERRFFPCICIMWP